MVGAFSVALGILHAQLLLAGGTDKGEEAEWSLISSFFWSFELSVVPLVFEAFVFVVFVVDFKLKIGEIGGGTCLPTRKTRQIRMSQICIHQGLLFDKAEVGFLPKLLFPLLLPITLVPPLPKEGKIILNPN